MNYESSFELCINLELLISLGFNKKHIYQTTKFNCAVFKYYKSFMYFICFINSFSGGLGGIGLELAEWLVKRGAKYLILSSRRGITNSYQSLCIYRWRKLGIIVDIITDDMTSVKVVHEVLTEQQNKGPIVGIFHLAMV